MILKVRVQMKGIYIQSERYRCSFSFFFNNEVIDMIKHEGTNGGRVRHRATLFASDSAEILFEFKNVDTGM